MQKVAHSELALYLRHDQRNMAEADRIEVLVLPGWYPNRWFPYSGDFVQYQTAILREQGIAAGLLHLDLDYRYMRELPLAKWSFSSFRDDFDIPCFRLAGFFPPKMHAVLLRRWARQFYTLFNHFQPRFAQVRLLLAHNYLGGLGAHEISQRTGIPYIVVEHSTAFLDGSLPPFHASLAQRALDNALEVWAVSSALQQALVSRTKTGVRVVPNFINVQLFRPGTQKEDAFTFVYIGDLIPRKQVRLLIAAFLLLSKDHPEARLSIVGRGPELEPLRRFCTSNDLQYVFFHGQKNQKDIAEWLPRCHCLVLPSRHETFGLVLIEALACGLPIVATNSGGPADIITSENGELATIHSAEALCHAMVRVMNNYDMYDAEEIRRDMLRRFGVDHQLDLLQAVLSASRS